MAISRAQMEEQIKGFENGGALDIFDPNAVPGLQQALTLDTDQLRTDVGLPTRAEDAFAELQKEIEAVNQAASPTRESIRAKFPASVESYRKQLEPLFGANLQKSRGQSFFDLASDLGAAMLSADPTAGAFRSLGAGFAAFNERTRKDRENKRSIDQQVALKAFELAKADEAAALDYLNKRDLKTLEISGKAYDPLIYEVDDVVDGKVVGKKQVRVNPLNPQEVAAIEANPSARMIKIPTSQVTVEAAKPPSRREVKAGDEFSALETKYYEEAKDAIAQSQMAGMFLNVLTKLGPKGFGAIQAGTLPVRKILADLGFNVDPEKQIPYQELANTLGTRISMGLIQDTKGAITEMEMRLFIAASPGLASTYDGAIQQAGFLKRLSERTVKRQREYLQAIKDGLFEGLESEADKIRAARQWETDWNIKQPFFTQMEITNLRKLARDQPEIARAFSDDFLRRRYGTGSKDIASGEVTSSEQSQENLTTDFSSSK